MNDMHKVIWPGWEIVRRIGSGSFGTVYEIQRDVYGDIEKAALKVIQLPRSEDEVDYLRCTGLDDASITMNFHQQVGDIAREYKLMAQMRNNPNVVRCDDFRDIQHDDGLGWDIYIKMELLSPLMKNLDKVATEEQVIQLGKDICNALISCQEKNIIHRDIKPQNVFISEAGVFKLGDFGIARTIEHATQATGGIGTYSYMAPEVEKNQRYDRTVDIYSVGLMMYWLLNERRGAFMPLPPAVPGYGDEEKARQRRFSGEPIPAPKHGSEKLKAIVLKACAFTPADRYQSAQEMWDALCALDGAAPVAGVAAGAAVPKAQPEAAFVAAAASAAVEYEDRTIGPGSTVPPKPVSVPEPVAAPEEVYEEDEKTVGPAFTPVAKKQEKAPKPQPVKTTPPKPAKAEKPKPAQPPKAPKPQPVKTPKPQPAKPAKEKSDKKSPVLYIVLGFVAAIVLFILLLAIPSCDNDTPEYTLPPVDTTPSTEAPTEDTTETTASTEPVGTAPAQQLDWSDWTDKLPENVTAELYDIEEKTVYSSRNLETTSSSNNTMAGWELFDTVEAGGGYGPWSGWSQNSVKESATRDVETKTQYRYKETTTSNSASLPGWTQYGSSASGWSNWSSWSTSAVSQSANRKVETRKEYRYRNTGSGGYSEWSGWSQWSDSNPGSSTDLREVETRTVTTNSYFYYQCSNCGGRWYAATCGLCNSTATTYRTGSGNLIMDPVSFAGSGYYQSNDGTGMVFMTSPNGSTQTQYRYRTRTQLSGSTGSWSAWGTTPYTATSTREVESRTVYRYCDKLTTYNYYRWTQWSDNKPGGGYESESKTFYRYRDQVSSTTYYFRRWTAWSEFTDGEVTKSDTVEVQTTTQYRYKSKTES